MNVNVFADGVWGIGGANGIPPHFVAAPLVGAIAAFDDTRLRRSDQAQDPIQSSPKPLDADRVGDFPEVFDLVEVHITVDLIAILVQDAHIGHVFGLGGDPAQP